MKELTLVKWDARLEDGTITKESMVTVLSLIMTLAADFLPKGMEGFRFMRRIAEVLDAAEKEGILKIAADDFKILKDLVEKHIPAKLAGSPVIFSEVEKFLGL